MAKRAIPSVDREVFRRTANKTKKINIFQRRYLGGIRM